MSELKPPVDPGMPGPTPPGFEGGESFQFIDQASAPAWTKDFYSFHGSEPCLALPSKLNGQPYSVHDAVAGDWVYANKDQTEFFVLKLLPAPPAPSQEPMAKETPQRQEDSDEPAHKTTSKRRY